jgi:hypothetical protein
MYARALILWFVPSLCLAYNPSAMEILSLMETALRKPDPVVVQIVRETPEGTWQREHSVRIPADSPETTAADQDFPFPFSFLTLPTDNVLSALKSIADGNGSVKLDRFEGSVCYLLEGRGERLWLRKRDFIPLKLESLSAPGEWTAYIYSDLISISGEAVYPSRTEVRRNGSLVVVERVIPARATPDEP